MELLPNFQRILQKGPLLKKTKSPNQPNQSRNSKANPEEILGRIRKASYKKRKIVNWDEVPVTPSKSHRYCRKLHSP